jgi:hypothetical protein
MLANQGGTMIGRKRGTLALLACVSVIASCLALNSSAATKAGCASPAGPAACATSPTAPLVTPAQASAAMTAIWKAEEIAYVTRDATALAGLETGSRLLEERYALAGLVCKCWTWYWTKSPRPISSLSVYVPRQDHYPLYFLAQVSTPASGLPAGAPAAAAALMVTRAAPSQPWKIAMQLWDTGYDRMGGVGFNAPATDTDGYDEALPTDAVAGAKTWPSLLAAYYSQIKTLGIPPGNTPFEPGPLTTQTDLGMRRQGNSDGGFVKRYSFHVGGEGAPWLLDLGGSVASCADVLETETLRPVKPHTVFVQHDGPGQAWGPDLDTGYYTKIVTTFDWPVCITPDAQDAGRLDVVGPTTGSYPIHDSGVPAKLGPGTTVIR